MKTAEVAVVIVWLLSVVVHVIMAGLPAYWLFKAMNFTWRPREEAFYYALALFGTILALM
jgi:hypothetical protein